MSQFTLREYAPEDGKSVFSRWLKRLDRTTRARIYQRVQRFERGNFGDSKLVGTELWEARLHFGPGYRVYYSKVENEIVLLLCGGDKSSQSKDIERAKEYLADYRSNEDG